MVSGPRAALERLAAAQSDPALAGLYRVEAVRAHLLEFFGEHEGRLQPLPPGGAADAEYPRAALSRGARSRAQTYDDS